MVTRTAHAVSINGTLIGLVFAIVATPVLLLCYFWGLYHWVILLQRVVHSSWLSPELSVPAKSAQPCRVALLYCVCDDFDPVAVQSGLEQIYPAFELIILDDSREPDSRLEIDCFASRHGIKVLRRTERLDYKAGNLNHALARLSDEFEMIAINDADEVLPPDFLRRAVDVLRKHDTLAFVQASHRTRSDISGPFSRWFHPLIDVRWKYYRSYANAAGLSFIYGHGVVVRTRVWKDVGGMPRRLSEDMAFSLKLSTNGHVGICSDEIVCEERFPDEYAVFRRRMARIIRADLECLSRDLVPYLFSRRPQLPEKFDALVRELRYPTRILLFPAAVMLAGVVPFLNHQPVPAAPVRILLSSELTGLHLFLLMGPCLPYALEYGVIRSVPKILSLVWMLSSLSLEMLGAARQFLNARLDWEVTFARGNGASPTTRYWADLVLGLLSTLLAVTLSCPLMLPYGASLFSSSVLSLGRTLSLLWIVAVVLLLATVSMCPLPEAAIGLLPVLLLF